MIYTHPEVVESAVGEALSGDVLGELFQHGRVLRMVLIGREQNGKPTHIGGHRGSFNGDGK